MTAQKKTLRASAKLANAAVYAAEPLRFVHGTSATAKEQAVTRKERSFTLEAAAIIGSALLLVLVVPALVNSRDTIPLFAAFLLMGGAVCWFAYFIYRLNKEFSK